MNIPTQDFGHFRSRDMFPFLVMDLLAVTVAVVTEVAVVTVGRVTNHSVLVSCTTIRKRTVSESCEWLPATHRHQAFRRGRTTRQRSRLSPPFL